MRYQRELNWVDPFHAVLGTYVYLPALTILWSTDSNSELWQFSARTATSKRFCCDNHLRLIDFRYAVLILSDILKTQLDGEEPYTSERVIEICMQMKQIAMDTSFGHMSYVIDGVFVCALNGNHVLLFDNKDVHECEEIPIPILGEGVEYADPPDTSPLIPDEPLRMFVKNGLSSTPTNVIMPSILPISKPVDKWSYSLLLLGFQKPNHHLDREDITARFQSIRWDESFSPVYGSFIEIPENTVMWRGYDTQYAAIAERPVYFGNETIAKAYADTSPTHTLGLFATTRPLKLLDIRFLKVLLKDLFYGRNGNVVQKTTVAFGLCSFFHQLRLMQSIFADSIKKGTEHGFKAMASVYKDGDFEQPGVRVAETSNDGWVMTFLSELFEGIVDGFISPELDSPYHYQNKGKMHPELIVFNPLKSGIVQLKSMPPTKEMTIADFIREQFPSPVRLRAYAMETDYVGCGGGSSRGAHKSTCVPAIEAFYDLVNRGHTESIQQYREALKEGRKLRKQIVFA